MIKDTFTLLGVRRFAAVTLLSCAHAYCAEPSNGLAPEVTSLNLKDKLFQLEAQLPDLKQPYISVAPRDMKDGLPVGKLGADGGNRALIEKYAAEIAAAPKDEKINNVDSLLASNEFVFRL